MQLTWSRFALATAVLTLLLAAGATAAAPVVSQSEDPNVAVVAHYPADDGYENELLVRPGNVANVGSPAEASSGRFRVTVTLTNASAESFAETLVDRRFTDHGVNDCRWESSPDNAGYCLVTYDDGEVAGAFSLGPSLAQSVESGSFVDDPRIVLTVHTEAQAERITAVLRDDKQGTAPTTDGGDVAVDSSAEGADGSDGGATSGFTVGAAVAALVAAAHVGRTRS